jgi:hypothetical protein
VTTAALTVALFEDAAAIAPHPTPYVEALRRHREHRAPWYADLVGPLLVPVSGLRALAQSLEEQGSVADPAAVVLVGDTGLVGLAQARAALLDDDRVDVVGVQVTLSSAVDLGDSARETLEALDLAVPAAVEVPLGDGWRDALDVLADDGAERAALRTGATGAVPTDHQVALFVHACVQRRLPLTLTGGGHALVRGTDPASGSDRHGVLNALAAVAVAADSASVDAVAEVVGLREIAVLVGVLDTADERVMRRWLTAISVASIDDARDGLVVAGLLDPPPTAGWLR